MKKILVGAVVLLALQTSCRDELTVMPNDRLTIDNHYTTENDFRKGLDYAYDAFKVSGYFSGDTSQMIVPDIVSDNLIQHPLGRRSNTSAYLFDFAANVGAVGNAYGATYGVVARANVVLSKLGNLSEGAAKKNFEAEARAIRAVAHFDNVIRYSKIPTQSGDANSSLGIAYIETFDPFQLVTRNLSVAEVYDKIIADLLFAEANITQTNVGRMNKAAVQGMLSRVYLYKGDYASAVTYGQKSLASSSSVGSLANFKKIWTDDSTDGVLFKISNSAVENIKTGSMYNQTLAGQIRSEYVVDYSLFTKYSNNDIRKSAYILTSPYEGKEYNHVIKYRQATGKPIEAVDVKYLRTAEVVLNTAEAAYRNGDQALALQLLNKLRKDRYEGYTDGTESGDALLSAILLERRLELAFENDRFFTLKRLGLPVQRSEFGPEANGAGIPASVKVLEASSYKWQWPIPQGAINNNPAIVQNPGY